MQIKTVKTEVKCRRKANQTRSERLIQLRSIQVLQVQHLLHLSDATNAFQVIAEVLNNIK